MINDIKKMLTWNNVTFRFAILLVVVLSLSFIDLIWFASTDAERIHDTINLVVLFAVSEGFYILNYYFIKLKNVNYLHLGITASIIFLLVHPTTPWFMYVVVMVLALLGKFLIRYKGAPVFNPAALGIALGYVVSVGFVKLGILKETLFESWWGADLQFTFYKFAPVLWVISVLLLASLIYFAKRYNKLNHAVSYYVAYIIITFLYLQVKGVPVTWSTYLLNIFTSSFIFLAFVMVSEPKTSPILKNQQVWLGILGAIFLFITNNFIPDYFPLLNVEIPTVLALLLLNGVTFLVKSRPITRPVAPAVPPVVNTPKPKVV